MGAPWPRAVARLRAWPFAPHTASTAPRPPRGRTGQDGAVTPAVPARAQQTLVGGQRQDGRGGGDGRGCLCHPARGRGAGSGETPGGWGEDPGSEPVPRCARQAQGPCAHALRADPAQTGTRVPRGPGGPPAGRPSTARPLTERLQGTACPPPPGHEEVGAWPGLQLGCGLWPREGSGPGSAPRPATPSGRPLSRATPSWRAPSSGEAGVITLLQDEAVEADRGQTVGSPGLTPEPGPGLAPHLPLGRPLPLRHPRRPWLGPTRPPGCSSGSQPVELSCLPWGGSGAQRAPQEAWGHPTLSPAGGPREALSLSLPLRPVPG